MALTCEVRKYVRPALCRLCKGPVADAGVRMDAVDAVKLGRWWLKALDVELARNETLNSAILICQFCLWDARFKSEREDGETNETCDWWTGHDSNTFYKKFFYDDHIIQPLEVKIFSTELTNDNQRLISTSSDTTVAVKNYQKYQMRKPTDCIFCGEKFTSKKAAYLHMFQSHSEVKKFSCSSCVLVFKTVADKFNHCKIFHDIVTCHFCRRDRKREHLREHIAITHPDNNLICCGTSFQHVEDLLGHMNTSRTSRVKINRLCVYCNKSVECMGRHVKANHSQVAFKCTFTRCGKYFLSREEMQQHLSSREHTKNRIQCPYCPATLVRGLASHVTLMHKLEAIRCSSCATYFKSEQEKEQHFNMIHIPRKHSYSKKTKCVYCDRELWKIRMLDHVNSKHSSQKIMCDEKACCAFFLNKMELDSHRLEKHSGSVDETPFKCKECAYGGRTANALGCHIQTKHGTENFVCQTCSKTFKCKYQFKTHQNNVHNNFKICEHCKSKVKTGSWGVHFFIIPCRKCNKSFTCAGLKKAHKSTCKKQKMPFLT